MDEPTVLYIEDNPDNRILVSRILLVEDINVIDAPDGVLGLELALAHRPDLILMDINLPGTDGYQLTRQFKAMPELQNIPIVALTANVMDIHRQQIADAGCDGFISKPIDVDRLPQQVRQFLKGA